MNPLERLLLILSGRLHAYSLCRIAPGWRLRFPPGGGTTLHFVLAGEGAVRGAEGNWRRFGAHDVVAVPPGQPLRLGDPADGAREVEGLERCGAFADGMLAFTAGPAGPNGSAGPGEVLLACGALPREPGPAAAPFDLDGGPAVLPPPDAHHRAALERMLAEVRAPALGTQAMLEALMRQSLVLLLRARLRRHGDALLAGVPAGGARTGGNRAGGPGGDPRLARAALAVLERPGDAHDLGSLAARAGMGRSAFAEGFSRAFGRGPMDYVREARLDAAARLLATTTLPVKTVAASVGYRSRSAFSRAFAAGHGSDPTAFRRAAGGAG